MGTTNADLLAAFNKAVNEINGRIDTLETRVSSNGSNGSGKGTKKADGQVWKNTVGYECATAMGAFWSSQKLVKHLRKECGCDPEATYRKKGKLVKGYRCAAVKRYGQTYDTWGSDPNAVIPADVIKAVEAGK